MYFLHHDASLSGSIWDCVYWGWVELRWRLLNSTKLLNKLKHPKENNIMIWFFSDKKNVCQDQIYNKQNNRWMSPKWLKPSFLRQYGVRCGLRRRHAPALLWGQVKGQHQHLPRGYGADSVALALQHSGRSLLGLAAGLCPLSCVQQVHGLARTILFLYNLSSLKLHP